MSEDTTDDFKVEDQINEVWARKDLTQSQKVDRCDEIKKTKSENLSKREWFTGIILGALLSTFKVAEGDTNRDNKIKITVECAVALADASLAKLSETK